MNKAVFLDRDGTINVDKGYVYKAEDFKFIKGSIEAIKKINDNGYKAIVVTNQSGIARGYYQEEDVIRLHKIVNEVLKKSDAHIDCFYYCPHHYQYGIGKYKVECSCRKPKSGMIERAIIDFDIDVSQSWLIGDSKSDIVAGENAKIRSLLLSDSPKSKNEFVSLNDAVNFIINGL